MQNLVYELNYGMHFEKWIMVWLPPLNMFILIHEAEE